jgi:hypothetical protein
MKRSALAFALCMSAAASTSAFAAAPEITYLQNAFDGRAKCLGAGDTVAMAECDKSAAQQWVLERGAQPGYFRVHTVAGGDAACLMLDPAKPKDLVSMAACSDAPGQQWGVERSASAPYNMQFTNRATGKTRCLESIATGLKITSCERKARGHLWAAQWSPTM